MAMQMSWSGIDLLGYSLGNRLTGQHEGGGTVNRLGKWTPVFRLNMRPYAQTHSTCLLSVEHSDAPSKQFISPDPFC